MKVLGIELTDEQYCRLNSRIVSQYGVKWNSFPVEERKNFVKLFAENAEVI